MRSNDLTWDPDGSNEKGEEVGVDGTDADVCPKYVYVEYRAEKQLEE